MRAPFWRERSTEDEKVMWQLARSQKGPAMNIRSTSPFLTLSNSLRPGEFIGLVGPNGVGKSALLRGLRGFLKTGSRNEAGGHACMTAYISQWPDTRWPLSVFQVVAMGRRNFVRGLFSRLGEADRAACAAGTGSGGLGAGAAGTGVQCGVASGGTTSRLVAVAR